MATQEVFLDLSDYELIGEEFRILWNTRRLALHYPTASVLRYNEYPNPDSLTQTTIENSLLNIQENIVGRTINLVEGALDRNYVVTGYTTTSITVASATFVTDGFTVAATFHIEALSYQQLASPTKVQVLSVEDESLLNREVAYYNLTEKEILQFNNELDTFDRRFVFYDVTLDNNDQVVLEDQIYNVYKTFYSITYNKSIVFGKAVRKD